MLILSSDISLHLCSVALIPLLKFLFRLTKANSSAQLDITTGAIERKFPLMLKFLGNEDDDVSAAVCSFAHDYVTMLKHSSQMAQTHRDKVEVLSLWNIL